MLVLTTLFTRPAIVSDCILLARITFVSTSTQFAVGSHFPRRVWRMTGVSVGPTIPISVPCRTTRLWAVNWLHTDVHRAQNAQRLYGRERWHISSGTKSQWANLLLGTGGRIFVANYTKGRTPPSAGPSCISWSFPGSESPAKKTPWRAIILNNSRCQRCIAIPPLLTTLSL